MLTQSQKQIMVSLLEKEIIRLSNNKHYSFPLPSNDDKIEELQDIIQELKPQENISYDHSAFFLNGGNYV